MKSRLSFEFLKKIQGVIIISIGLIGLIGWISNNILLASYNIGYIPMAPDTAILFVIFGLFLLANFYKSHIKSLSALTISLISLYGFLKTVEFFAEIDLTFSNYISNIFENREGYQLQKMSPVTGFLFLLAGISFLLKAKYVDRRAANTAIAVLGSIITFTGFTVVVGYLFQTPLLYNSKTIPMALSTAICFVFLGLATIILSGRKNFITRQFVGKTSYNILIRKIVPILFFVILFQGLILKYFYDSSTLNFALFSALLSLFFILLTSTIIIQISKSVFQNAILAEAKSKQAELIVKSKDELFKLTAESAKVGSWEYDVRTKQTTLSPEIVGVLEFDTGQNQNLQTFENALTKESYKVFISAIETSINKGISTDFEIEILTGCGNTRYLRVIGIPVTEDVGVKMVRGIIHDITNEKDYHKKQLLLSNILSLLNKPNEWSLLIDQILSKIKESLQIDAVAIRLREGNDFPYNHTIGLNVDFLDSENTLCPKVNDAEIEKKQTTSPLLECFCGAVINGNIDSSKNYYTQYGSFWVNSTSTLNGNIAKEELPYRYRNYCNLSGYESVALIPLRSENGTIGLFQLNDKRTNRFSLQTVSYLEELSSLIGLAFNRIQTENIVKESEKRFRVIFESAAIGVALIDSSWKPIKTNQRYCDILGYSMNEMLNINLIDITYPDDIEISLSQRDKIINGEVSEYTIIKRYFHKSGEVVWVKLFVSPMSDTNKYQNYYIAIVEDVSAQKLIEKALQDSEEHFRSITQTASDAIISMDEKGKILTWNNAAVSIFGYSEVEVLNSELFQLIAPKEIGSNIGLNFRSITDIIETSFIDKTLEINAIRKDGSTFPAELSVSSYLKDNNWHPTAIIRDISKRKLAEQAVQNRIREIQCLQNITQITDKDNLTLGKFFNKVVRLIPTAFQYPECTKCRIVFNEQTFQSSSFNEGKYRLSVDIVIRNKPVGFIEVFFYDEICPKTLTPFLKEEKGLLITISKILSEFIERKRKEQIQKIIYNSSIAVDTTESLADLIDYIKNQIGTLIDTTNFFAAFYDEDTDTISLPYHSDQKDNISHFPAGRTLTKHVIKTQMPLLVTKKQINEMERRGLIELDSNRAKVWLGVPLIVKGNVTGIFAVQSYDDENAYNVEDLEMLEFIARQVSISIERKKAEQDLRVAFEKAKESDRLKSTFLATMSHELRTPLNAVIGFSDMMKGVFDTKRVTEYAGIINKSGLNLLEIIEDIFNITLLESGEIKTSKDEFHAKQFMEDIVLLVELEKEKLGKNFLVQFIPPKEIDSLILKTDRTKLKQILLNILKNALKFTFNGSVEYGFNIDEYKNNHVVKFFVMDTGIGIRKEHTEVIFDTFRQVDDSNTRIFGGTGLGLSLSKRYLEMIGGDIWVESTFGKGSTFYFTIPGYELHEVDEKAVKKIDTSPKLKDKTILIAEDEESNYELLIVYLEELEVNTMWAHDGAEAISICETHSNIDLVLMDIKMPGVNGIDATLKIREIRPNLPIIAQTAFALQGDDKKALEAGCNDYISKPIKRRDLYLLITKYLSN